MDSDIVTDITRYSIEDILSIFNIVDPTTANVTDAANSLIALMKREDNTEIRRRRRSAVHPARENWQIRPICIPRRQRLKPQ